MIPRRSMSRLMTWAKGAKRRGNQRVTPVTQDVT